MKSMASKPKFIHSTFILIARRLHFQSYKNTVISMVSTAIALIGARAFHYLITKTLKGTTILL